MFPGWQIVEALWVAKELGLNRFVCEQPAYHMLDRTAEREVIPRGAVVRPRRDPVGAAVRRPPHRQVRPHDQGAATDAGRAARTTSTGRPRRWPGTSSICCVGWRARRAARSRRSRSPGAGRSRASRRRSSARGPSSRSLDNLGAVERADHAEDSRAIDALVPPRSAAALLRRRDGRRLQAELRALVSSECGARVQAPCADARAQCVIA